MNPQIVVWERQVYTKGSGPPLKPVTLVPSNIPPAGKQGWSITEKLMGKQSKKNMRTEVHNAYVLCHNSYPELRQEVRLQDILNWVSPKALEDYELALDTQKEHERWSRASKVSRYGGERLPNISKSSNKAGKSRVLGGERKKGRPVGWRKPSVLGYNPYSAYTSHEDPTEHEEEDEIEDDEEEGDLRSLGTISLKRQRDMFEEDMDRRSSLPSLSETPRKKQRRLSLMHSQSSLSYPAMFHEDTSEGQEISDSEESLPDPSSMSISRPAMTPPPPLSSYSRSLRSRSRSVLSTIKSRPEVSKRSPSFEDDRMSAPASRSPVDRPMLQSIENRNSSGSSTESIIEIPSIDWSGKPGAKDSQLAKTCPLAITSEGQRERQSSAASSSSAKPIVTAKQTKPKTEPKPILPPKKNPTKKRNSKTQVQEEEPEYIVKDILEHRFRIVNNKQVLEFLIDWECEWEGQWDPSWEPDNFVSDDLKNAYQLRIAGVEDWISKDSDDKDKPRHGHYRNKEKPSFLGGKKNGPPTKIKGSAKETGYMVKDEDEEESYNSPSAQLKNELLAGDERLEVVSPHDSEESDPETLFVSERSRSRRLDQ